jgi:hypothetical protein
MFSSLSEICIGIWILTSSEDAFSNYLFLCVVFGETSRAIKDQTEQFKQRNRTEAERLNILFTLAGSRDE